MNMNILRNSLSVGVSSVRKLISGGGHVSSGSAGGVLNSFKGTGLNAEQLPLSSSSNVSSSRSYGTLRALGSPLHGPCGGGNQHHPSSTASLLRVPFNNDIIVSSQLSPASFYIQSRGMKFKGKVRRRCKDCFMMWVNGMLYNLCKTHPRHKQGLKPPYFVNQRILTSASQSPKRPW